MKIFLCCLFFTLTSLTETANVPSLQKPKSLAEVLDELPKLTSFPQVQNDGDVTLTPPNVLGNLNSPSLDGFIQSALSGLKNIGQFDGLGDLNNVLYGLPVVLHGTISTVPGLEDFINSKLELLNSFVKSTVVSSFIQFLGTQFASILEFLGTSWNSLKLFFTSSTLGANVFLNAISSQPISNGDILSGLQRKISPGNFTWKS